MIKYTKLFVQMYEGSMRGKPDLLLVFPYIFSHATADGIFDQTPQCISDALGLPLDRTLIALQQLEAPDPESRTPDEDGRRIVRLDPHRTWGWRVVNREKYWNLYLEGDYREQTKERVRRFRDRQKLARSNGEGTPEPSFESSEPTRNPLKTETLEAFNKFWKAYPKKRNIIESQRAFVEVQGAAHIKEILAALSWQTESDEWSDNDGKYIPSPVNYLRDRRWEDEGDGTGPKVPDEENPLITVRGGKMFNACGLHWSRTDGGPRREQFGKGDDQESAYQACRTGYDSWIQTPEKKNGQ